MQTLGVTGGIGSGKTTACRHFEALGARVFYADVEAKRLMVDDSEARAAIVDAFGAESYTDEGRLNRSYLASRVFGDEAQLARLNSIVHPRVRQAFFTARDRAAADSVPLFVYEAALIYETGGDRHLDAVAVVDAPIEVRVQRVVARDDVTAEQVRARMQHQIAPAELRARADYIIYNDGPPEALRTQVERIYRALTADEDG